MEPKTFFFFVRSHGVTEGGQLKRFRASLGFPKNKRMIWGKRIKPSTKSCLCRCHDRDMDEDQSGNTNMGGGLLS